MKDAAKIEGIIDLYLSEFPYYGEFEIPANNFHKHISEEDRKELYQYLVSCGYANKRNDVREPGLKIGSGEVVAIYNNYLDLTERGRWLKQCGSMESYREYQAQKKEKARKDEEERATAIQRNIQMNRLTCWIALSTGLAALYYVLEILNHFLGFYCH